MYGVREVMIGTNTVDECLDKRMERNFFLASRGKARPFVPLSGDWGTSWTWTSFMYCLRSVRSRLMLQGPRSPGWKSLVVQNPSVNSSGPSFHSCPIKHSDTNIAASTTLQPFIYKLFDLRVRKDLVRHV